MYIDKLNKEDTHSHPSTPLHRRRRHRQLSMVAPSNKLGVYMEQKAEDAYTHAYDQLIWVLPHPPHPTHTVAMSCGHQILDSLARGYGHVLLTVQSAPRPPALTLYYWPLILRPPAF